MKQGTILVQLGSPKSPSVGDVRRYLRVFLGDPRVVDLGWWWKLVLYFFVLPLRPFRSAKLYARIWDGKKFPLVRYTESAANKLQSLCSDQVIRHGFIIGTPSIANAINECVAAGCTHLVFVPLFPQYAEASSASAIDAIEAAIRKTRTALPSRIVEDFHDNPSYIDAVFTLIKQTLNQQRAANTPTDEFVISFHGYPIRRILKGDPYANQSLRTARLLFERIVSDDECGLRADQILLSFQSKFGREPWLEPATDRTILERVAAGKKRMTVACPGFTADCLETVDELGNELGHPFREAGGEQLTLVPCLNDSDSWVAALRKIVTEPDAGQEPTQASESWAARWRNIMTATGTEPLSPQAKNVLRVVFLTLFIDLIGFSIIFPLFPAMLKYYTLNDHSSYLLTFFTGLVDRFQQSAGGTGERVPIVLFGGLIGSIYAFLQFLFSPVWGSLSDKHGRKPVLTLCLAGIALSYVGWFFSKSFDLLVLSRVLSGAMAGNISVATAAVADVTNEKTRSKGMAIVGIAFGLGFIIGPAVGGLSSLWDLTHYFPALADLGVNPFSVPALIACVLALVNVSMMLRKLPETLPKDRREKQTSYRTINPLAILQTTQYPGVAASILTYFIYLTIFSGMEFTLTFLAADRLNYTPRANGMMFLFVGTILALVQGGYVRRKAHDIGEKRLALQGLVLIVPGLVVTGIATTSIVLYVGLFFLACGSAMVIPALTSLTSLYAPQTVQGRVLGIFRSMGALSRAVGPLIACVLYWKLSGQSAYIVGGLFMVLPIALALRLPPVKSAGA